VDDGGGDGGVGEVHAGAECGCDAGVGHGGAERGCDACAGCGYGDDGDDDASGGSDDATSSQI